MPHWTWPSIHRYEYCHPLQYCLGILLPHLPTLSTLLQVSSGGPLALGEMKGYQFHWTASSPCIAFIVCIWVKTMDLKMCILYATSIFLAVLQVGSVDNNSWINFRSTWHIIIKFTVTKIVAYFTWYTSFMCLKSSVLQVEGGCGSVGWSSNKVDVVSVTAGGTCHTKTRGAAVITAASTTDPHNKNSAQVWLSTFPNSLQHSSSYSLSPFSVKLPNASDNWYSQSHWQNWSTWEHNLHLVVAGLHRESD